VSRENAILLPVLEANEKSSLAIFNEAVLHKNCFDVHPLKKKILQRIKEIEKLQPKSQNDFITGEPLDIEHIGHPDNQVNVFYITDDKANPLYKFNGIALNKRNLAKWEEFKEFLCLLDQLNASDDWAGRSLEFLISQLTSPVKDSYSKEFLEKMKARYPNITHKN
jgi:hypothetical protein